MSSITSKSGDKLITFRAGRQPTRLEDYPDLHISFACVIAKYQGKTLFVYNPWRDEWELPAGIINPGETPFDAAQREFAEETGQRASEFSYKGMCLLVLHGQDQLELGAIYLCQLEQVDPFRANDETTGIMLWNSEVKTQEYVNEIGIELARLVDKIQ